MYTEYISNFDNALKVLDESCKKNKSFEELVREFEVCTNLICYLYVCISSPLESANLWKPTTEWLPFGNCPEDSSVQASLTRLAWYNYFYYNWTPTDYLKHLPKDSHDRQDSESMYVLS